MMNATRLLDMGAGVMVSLVGIWGLVLWGIPAVFLEASILQVMEPRLPKYKV